MNFRKGMTSDIDSIIQLVESVKDDLARKGIHQWDNVYPTKEDFLEDVENGTLYVAELDNRVIGLCVISEESDEAYTRCTWINPNETACVLHRLCVDPRYQNRGFGRKILQYAEKMAKEFSYDSMRLDVFNQNPHAVNLYRNFGYAERGFADWRKGRFLLMEKKL